MTESTGKPLMMCYLHEDPKGSPTSLLQARDQLLSATPFEAKKTNENRGLASALSQVCSSIWVTLIEKAFAKFYTSYSVLSKGLCSPRANRPDRRESECIPLAPASRGAGKRALCDRAKDCFWTEDRAIAFGNTLQLRQSSDV